MPEHNEESLGTRDLASPSSTGATATTAESDPPAPAEADRGDDRADRSDDQADHRDDAPTNEPLLPSDVTGDFQRRWEEVQARFVDEPHGAVEQADGLVAKLMQQLAGSFARERERLEAQWGRGEDISTEDLRVALQRYRSFFQRLLST